jgi:hypothetical protein
MFNRTDSFDTFACSADLDRDFVEKDLAPFCDNKPSQQEAAALRTQKLDNGYYQLVTKEGMMVQSCIAYLPTDYTGERSTYLVHNLVYTAQEAAAVLNQPDSDLYNPDMFVTDIEPFDITNAQAKPLRDYPLLDFAAKEIEPTEWVLKAFDLTTIKRFIYACLMTACGKIKSVYFLLTDHDASDLSLRFVNTMLQIMPYHLRPELSFATRLSDINRFNNIKLKALNVNLPHVPQSKGAVFDFLTKTATGVKDEDINANGQVVEFFYSLLSNEALRREFLRATHHAVSVVPSLGALNMKALADLVFLFRASSGMYDEATILPNDDRVTDFFLIYEKARPALSDEYRINACKTLQRYPKSHQAIPKQVFSKLSKMYPTEIKGTQHVIMQVALDLIHTDIMRDKLFGFIRNNYKNEDEETKRQINLDLSRVFYGGFLQPQILEFFNDNFDQEPEDTRDFVVEKVLLAIRTKPVQHQILDFLRNHYDLLSDKAKDMVYDTLLENLPEGDELSLTLGAFVDQHVPTEREELRARIAKQLCKELENEQRRKDHPMLETLPQMNGFVYNVAVGMIMSTWSGRKIFEEYCDIISRKDATERLQQTLRLWQTFDFIDQETADKLLDALVTATGAHPVRLDIYVAMQMETTFAEAMAQVANPCAAAFCEGYLKRLLRPMVGNAVWDVFRHPDKTGGAELVTQYVAEHPEAETNKMKVVADYLAIKEAMLIGNAEQCVHHIESLPKDRAMRTALANYLQQEIGTSVKVGLTVCFLYGVINYLKTGGLALRGVYETRQEPFEVPVGDLPDEALRKARANKKQDKIDQTERRLVALREVLSIGNAILEYAETEDFRDCATNESSEMSDVLIGFVNSQEKHGVKQARAVMEKLYPKNGEFFRFCETCLKNMQPKKKGLFGK